MEGGKQLWVLTYHHLAFIGGWSSLYVASFRRGRWPSYAGDCFHTWAVRGRTHAHGRGCGGYGAHAHVRGGAGCHCGCGHVLVVWRKEEGGGECNDSPACADGDDGIHHHCLDDVACCHVVAFHCACPQL